MNKIKIFVAAPISGFSEKEQYTLYRNNILKMISELKETNEVFSEIEYFSELDSYDDPGKSAIYDFEKISESNVFILIHPLKMQSSTLIELGYALANKKNIIIISQKSNLPFLALELHSVIENVKLIQTNEIDYETRKEIVSIIERWQTESN